MEYGHNYDVDETYLDTDLRTSELLVENYDYIPRKLE